MTEKAKIMIRPARSDDRDFILSLVPRLVEFGPPAWRDGGQMISVDRGILSDKLESSAQDTAIFIAADENGAPLGFIHLHRGHDYYNSEPHGHISDVIVAPNGEGQGIGRLLMEKAEEWAHEQGYRWLTLSVFAENVRAREIYERAGYGKDIMKYVKVLK